MIPPVPLPIGTAMSDVSPLPSPRSAPMFPPVGGTLPGNVATTDASILARAGAARLLGAEVFAGGPAVLSGIKVIDPTQLSRVIALLGVTELMTLIDGPASAPSAGLPARSELPTIGLRLTVEGSGAPNVGTVDGGAPPVPAPPGSMAGTGPAPTGPVPTGAVPTGAVPTGLAPTGPVPPHAPSSTAGSPSPTMDSPVSLVGGLEAMRPAIVVPSSSNAPGSISGRSPEVIPPRSGGPSSAGDIDSGVTPGRVPSPSRWETAPTPVRPSVTLLDALVGRTVSAATIIGAGVEPASTAVRVRDVIADHQGPQAKVFAVDDGSPTVRLVVLDRDLREFPVAGTRAAAAFERELTRSLGEAFDGSPPVSAAVRALDDRLVIRWRANNDAIRFAPVLDNPGFLMLARPGYAPDGREAVAAHIHEVDADVVAGGPPSGKAPTADVASVSGDDLTRQTGAVSSMMQSVVGLLGIPSRGDQVSTPAGVAMALAIVAVLGLVAGLTSSPWGFAVCGVALVATMGVAALSRR